MREPALGTLGEDSDNPMENQGRRKKHRIKARPPIAGVRIA